MTMNEGISDKGVDALWKWLMRANARGVLLCSVLALLLVIAWWMWKLSVPIRSDVKVFSRPGSAEGAADLGLLAFLEKQAAHSEYAPLNLFMHPDNAKPLADKPIRPTQKPRADKPGAGSGPSTAGGAQGGQTAPAPDSKTAPSKPASAAQPGAGAPRPETISLTYKGLFKRTDGKTVVLVEDSKTGSSRFYETEADIHGMKVGEAAPEGMRVLQDDGSQVTLRRGQPEIFEGTKHVPR